MLRAKDGGVSLSWIPNKKAVKKHCKVTAVQLNSHVRSWPRSEEGKELLEEFRSVNGGGCVAAGLVAGMLAGCSIEGTATLTPTAGRAPSRHMCAVRWP